MEGTAKGEDVDQEGLGKAMEPSLSNIMRLRLALACRRRRRRLMALIRRSSAVFWPRWEVAQDVSQLTNLGVVAAAIVVINALSLGLSWRSWCCVSKLVSDVAQSGVDVVKSVSWSLGQRVQAGGNLLLKELLGVFVL